MRDETPRNLCPGILLAPRAASCAHWPAPGPPPRPPLSLAPSSRRKWPGKLLESTARPRPGVCYTPGSAAALAAAVLRPGSSLVAARPGSTMAAANLDVVEYVHRAPDRCRRAATPLPTPTQPLTGVPAGRGRCPLPRSSLPAARPRSLAFWPAIAGLSGKSTGTRARMRTVLPMAPELRGPVTTQSTEPDSERRLGSAAGSRGTPQWCANLAPRTPRTPQVPARACSYCPLHIVTAHCPRFRPPTHISTHAHTRSLTRSPTHTPTHLHARAHARPRPHTLTHSTLYAPAAARTHAPTHPRCRRACWRPGSGRPRPRRTWWRPGSRQAVLSG